jgi:hypothetical protein
MAARQLKAEVAFVEDELDGRHLRRRAAAGLRRRLLRASGAADGHRRRHSAFRSVLLDEGYVPQVVNAEAGYISAKRREDLTDDSLIGTMATVVVTSNGLVRLEVTGTGFYHSEQEFQNAVSDRQKRLLGRILSPQDPPPIAPR